MTTLFKEVSYSLSKLVEDIEMGEIGLPDIQRPFVWPNAKVRDLFDSMYRGFPVGYLLFWSSATNYDHRQIGNNSKQKVPRLLIVDGQQRLTSLYAVLKGINVLRKDYKTERIQIAFRPKDRTFEVADAATKRNPEFIPDITILWSKETSRRRVVNQFIARLSESRDVSPNEEDDLHEAIDRLYDLQSYPFTALELSSSVDEEQVADVFVRINSKGTPLNQADFILTLMSVFWDAGRGELEQFCRLARQPTTGKASPFNHFIQPDPDQLLRVGVGLAFRRARLKNVYSILRGKDMETDQFSDEQRTAQFAKLQTAQNDVLDLEHWHGFLKTLLRAGYRSSSMISSQTALLYSYIFYLIGKRDFKIDPYTLRNVIARWFFMVTLTGRYTSSPETKMEQDLADLRDVSSDKAFIDHIDRTIRDTLTDDFWQIALPNALATSSSRSPSLFAYYAALNLLDARVLYSHMKVSELLDPALKSKKSSLERHHLFPKNYLVKNGVSEQRDRNQIANYALVEWSDNISISDKAPSEYVPLYEARYDVAELDQMRYWHALPSNWQSLRYPDFLEKRRKMIAQVIRDGFGKL